MLFLLASYYHNFFRRIYNSKPICGNNNGDPLALILPVPNPVKEKKFTFNFYFHTSLWYLKRLYEGLKEVRN